MKKIKLLSTVVLVLVIVLGLAVWAVVRQRELNNSQVKIYRDKKYNFKFKYPEDWYIKNVSENLITILSADIEIEPYIKDSSKIITITIFKNKEILPSPYFPLNVKIVEKNINIDGAIGKEYLLTEIGDEKRKAKWILIEREGIFYELVVDIENSRTLEIFNSFLESFEFIEESSL